jgi:hypothetical protein
MFSSNASSSAAGDANYIEDVFSTWLYAGNSGTQNIVNNIDLSTKGGLVWIKGRDIATNNILFDTNRGVNNYLVSDGTNAQANPGASLSAFNTNGFQVTDLSNFINETGFNYASWTFREQPNFFDVVTYTGNGANRTIAHNLGSVPGCIIVKRTDATADWQVYHRANTANPETDYLVLNSTAATADSDTRWNDTQPTSSVFSLGTEATVNASGGTYVAYLFAHNAGGFGLTGTDNVISCGSFTTDGSAMATVNLGYEPQWLLVKASSTADSWYLVDSMRGWPANGSVTRLFAQDATAEGQSSGFFNLTSTGFATIPSQGGPIANATFIYIAIRRGPTKVPTTGTSVFSPNVTASQPSTLTSPPASDLVITRIRESDNPTWNSGFIDRLRGDNINLVSSSTDAEVNQGSGIASFTSSQAFVGGISASSMVWYLLKRAPGYFDVVCYTGNSTNQTIAHNLGVAPELMIAKKRSGTGQWPVYAQPLGATKYLQLNTSSLETTGVMWNNTAPTASVFSVGADGDSNLSGATYVAYLFATCPGVSKVGSYTGTGTTQTINCGFTAGSRFVMIKRTDTGGNWYVWDTARGIIAGNDPYLLLDSSGPEVTSTDYIDTFSSGFEISSTAPAAINANGGTFIFLAIA